MLQFPEGYYEDELREGFYVNGLMKRCWAAQLEILSDINSICEKYNIKWFIDCGTLLGAVRHGGFVPWDDDVDICMLRDDYMKFIAVADEELKQIWKGYKLLNFRNGDYWEVISRVVDMYAINFDTDRVNKFHGFPLEVGVDIFPIDYLCANRVKEKERMDVCNAIFSIADDERLKKPDEYIHNMLSAIEHATGYKFDRKNSLQMQLYELGENMFSLYGKEQAKEVALMGYWLKDESHSYALEWFENIVQLPFEHITLPAPAGYDQVLKKEYGDYMRIVRTGGAHNYPRYGAQIEALEKEMGEDSPFHKKLSSKDINSVTRKYGNGNPRKEIKNQILDLIMTLSEAHEEIRKLLDNSDMAAVITMLEDCQAAAIEIGTFIEENFGEGLEVIHQFECYCELVYKLHEILTDCISGLDIIKECDVLNSQLAQMKKGVEDEIKVHREIVFVPYKASLWCYMNEIWEKCNSNPYTDVYVMPVPYYDKLPIGTLGERHYEMDRFPSELQVINYGDYDFEARQPDEVYIQNPFDMDNYSTTIHPYYYAKNLKQYTDKLVYIQSFIHEEIQEGEERAYKAMNQYAISAGVVYADKVYVQSEHMKKMYIRKLKEYFGEDTALLWENKMIGGELEVYNPESFLDKREFDMPESWKRRMFRQDGSSKKVIMYYIGVSGLYEYREKMLSKINRVFEVFRNCKEEIVVLWHPDSLIESVIPSVDPHLYNEYQRLVEQYKEEDFLICDSSNDNDSMFDIVDAYYGDAGRLVQLFRNKSIPVMIQNVEI